ncbi:hypothetical protein BCR43DRAFT_520118 [Syncephalastrum racemosum]|uniref:RhoGAP-domain-containing protein n=1 Tax=Syncephalastrum racemosum TaxID=13706 RepID=A0A1X2HTG7_SYNRA|nr:hypothetical protein BCR43DRAFT_520118 [Syncephalastrum racemosum]
MSTKVAAQAHMPPNMPTDLTAQNEELWRIVEKQRVVIQNLQNSLSKMTAERDGLLERNQDLEEQQQQQQEKQGRHSPVQNETLAGPARSNTMGGLSTEFLEASMFGSSSSSSSSNNNNNNNSNSNGSGAITNSNPSPVPPPRSPYRQNHVSNTTQSALPSPVSDESVNGGGATIIEPSLPATYGKLSPLPSARRDPPSNSNQNQNQNPSSKPYMRASSSTNTSRSKPPPVNTTSKEGDRTPSFNDLLNFSFSPTEMDSDKDKERNPVFNRYQDALGNGSSHKQQSVSAKETTTLSPPPARKATGIDTFPVPPSSVDQHQRDELPSPAQTFGYDTIMDERYRTGQTSSDDYTQAQPNPRQPYPGPYQNRTQTRDEAQHSHPTYQNNNNHSHPVHYSPPDTHHQQQQLRQQYQQSPSTPHFEQPVPRFESSPSPRPVISPSQPSQEAISQGVTSGPMAGIQIAVLSSKNFVNEKNNQDIVCFTLSVRKAPDANPQGPPEELWRIQKLYSDIAALDAKLKSQGRSVTSKLGKMPETSLFSGQGSFENIDQRNAAMGNYLRQAFSLQLADMTDLCEFLSSNVIDKATYKVSKYKQGYLTKRGKNFGGWKSRFFMLDGPVLKYYESEEGQFLGSIRLTEAQIVKSTPPKASETSKEAQMYRHAFMIVEPKKSAPGGFARHVLCADTDEERDVWVEAMSQHIDPEAAAAAREEPKRSQKLKQEEIKPGHADHERKAFWSKKMFSSEKGHPNQAKPLAPGDWRPDANEPRGAKQVFGVPLEEAIAVSKFSDQYELPAIVYRCIDYLEAKDAIQEEGIYRLSGSAVKIRKLKARFNEEGDVDLMNAEEPPDIHAVSGLLKMWLRELPDNVLTHDLLKDFLAVLDLPERRERVNELGRLVSLLPLCNYTLMRTLSAHLIRVVQNAGMNKMTMRNVGIVFSATLGIPTGIFSLLLTEFDYIFYTSCNNASPTQEQPQHRQPEPQPQPQQQRQQQPATPTAEDHHVQHVRAHSPPKFRNNRNSVSYTHGAPQFIVGLERHQGAGPRMVVDEEEEGGDEYGAHEDYLGSSDDDSGHAYHTAELRQPTYQTAHQTTTTATHHGGAHTLNHVQYPTVNQYTAGYY